MASTNFDPFISSIIDVPIRKISVAGLLNERWYAILFFSSFIPNEDNLIIFELSILIYIIASTFNISQNFSGEYSKISKIFDRSFYR